MSRSPEREAQEIADVVAERRRSLWIRLTFGAAIVVIFAPLANAVALCLSWFAVYSALQVLEALYLRRPRSALTTFAFLNLNAWVYSSIALLAPIVDGAWGVTIGVCLLSCSAAFAVLSTFGSFRAFLVGLIPPIALMVAMSALCLVLGAEPRHAFGVLAAALLVGVGCLLIWRRAGAAFRAERRARARAEAADAAKSAFVAMVSHELRTPISAILAGAAEGARAPTEAARMAQMEMIADAGRMMRVLLNDLLDLSKLEAGRMTVESTPFEFRRLLSDTLRFWRPAARRKGLRLRLQGAAAAPRWLQGDPTRVRQVLNNLLSNAVKFTEAGAVTVTVSAQQAGPTWTVKLEITDTGAGMSAEQASLLFQPYAQADGSVARTHGGTGLGLAISRELARLLGGDVAAASDKGVGSTFTFTFVAQAADAPPRRGAATSEFEGLRILVADDHAVNRRAFELMLAPIAERLVLAEDGLAALAAAEAEPFDVVLLDLNMPGLNGAEVAEQLIAGLGPERFTRILALTGSGSVAVRAACETIGMDGFVEKPVDAHGLYAALEAALGAPPRKPMAA